MNPINEKGEDRGAMEREVGETDNEKTSSGSVQLSIEFMGVGFFSPLFLFYTYFYTYNMYS